MKKILLLLITLFSVFEGYCQTSKIIGQELYTSSKSEKAKQSYNAGLDAMAQQNFHGAIRNYKLAIAEDPGYVDAYDNLGVAFRQLNMLDSAEFYYLLSIKKYPKGTISRRNLAIVEEKKGNPAKALIYYKQALAIDDKDPETHFGLMRVYLENKQFAEALESGNTTEKLYAQRNDPNIGDCYYMLCVTHLLMNNKTKAKQYAALATSKGITIDKELKAALE